MWQTNIPTLWNTDLETFKYRSGPVFKWWSEYQSKFSPVFKWNSNNRPFGDQTIFKHSNTRLVRYSDPYCYWWFYFQIYSRSKNYLFLQVIDLQQKLGIRVSGASPPKPVSSFAHFGFDEALLKAIRKSEFTQPTPIQAKFLKPKMSQIKVFWLPYRSIFYGLLSIYRQSSIFLLLTKTSF